MPLVLIDKFSEVSAGKYVRENGILDKEVCAFRDTMDLNDPFHGIIVFYK